jgi:hypothetical protein
VRDPHDPSKWWHFDDDKCTLLTKFDDATAAKDDEDDEVAKKKKSGGGGKKKKGTAKKSGAKKKTTSMDDEGASSSDDESVYDGESSKKPSSKTGAAAAAAGAGEEGSDDSGSDDEEEYKSPSAAAAAASSATGTGDAHSPVVLDGDDDAAAPLSADKKPVPLRMDKPVGTTAKKASTVISFFCSTCSLCGDVCCLCAFPFVQHFFSQCLHGCVHGAWSSFPRLFASSRAADGGDGSTGGRERCAPARTHCGVCGTQKQARAAH